MTAAIFWLPIFPCEACDGRAAAGNPAAAPCPRSGKGLRMPLLKSLEVNKDPLNGRRWCPWGMMGKNGIYEGHWTHKDWTCL